MFQQDYREETAPVSHSIIQDVFLAGFLTVAVPYNFVNIITFPDFEPRRLLEYLQDHIGYFVMESFSCSSDFNGDLLRFRVS